MTQTPCDGIKIRVAQTSIILPRSEAIASCYVASPTNTSHPIMLTAQPAAVYRKQLFIAPAVLHPGRAFLLVTNPFSRPEALYEHQQVAAAVPLATDDSGALFEASTDNHGHDKTPVIAVTDRDTTVSHQPLNIDLSQCENGDAHNRSSTNYPQNTERFAVQPTSDSRRKVKWNRIGKAIAFDMSDSVPMGNATAANANGGRISVESGTGAGPPLQPYGHTLADTAVSHAHEQDNESMDVDSLLGTPESRSGTNDQDGSRGSSLLSEFPVNVGYRSPTPSMMDTTEHVCRTPNGSTVLVFVEVDCSMNGMPRTQNDRWI
ncbi:hypothetical protein OSTOST_08032 [Ostertagia ostertagi]